MAKPYQHVGGLKPRLNVFNTSQAHLYDCRMGELIPVYVKECIPGDRKKITFQAVVRFLPLIAPILHTVMLRVFSFFVPTRLLMNRETMQDLGDSGEWENFITGGEDGTEAPALPLWGDTIINSQPAFQYPAGGYPIGSLYDHLGHEPGVIPTQGSKPLAFSKRGYNLIYNEYFRDQNVEEKIPLDSDVIKYVMWQKDRFTSALYDTQRGDRPAIPLQGLTSVNFNGIATNGSYSIPLFGIGSDGTNDILTNSGYGGTVSQYNTNAGGNPPVLSNYPSSGDSPAVKFKNWLNNNSINLSQAVTFDTIEMRRLFQIQKYLERNMRVGSRYTEQLVGRFGVFPEDQRLQRPEYIGGANAPILISEVLQTSKTEGSQALGEMGGHAITAEVSKLGRYNVREHGYLYVLAVIQPKTLYTQGIERIWQRRTRYDFPTPELVNLSEIGVKNSELVITGNARDDEIFGFQGIYDEMRVSEDRVSGNMRTTLNYWHLGRDDFNRANPPNLNYNFIKCQPTERIFTQNIEPNIIVHFGTHIIEQRPLPVIAEPGLIDHH